jgi:hypothetical protein
MLNLVTDHGDIDLAFTPAGQAGGFDGWRRHASAQEVSDGLTVLNRLKDQRDLPYLESLRDELGRA